MAEVSVVIPTHNRHEKLANAIKSVLDQTYQNFELVIVDDKSTDDTRETVEGFNDDRIIYLRNQRNLGGGGSRNVGIRISDGEFIAFLDDDDEWFPKKLEKQVKVLKDTSSTFCGVYTGLVKYKNGLMVSKKVNDIDGDLFETLLWENIIGSTSVVMLKKEHIMEVGGFTETLPASQELDLFIRLSKRYKFKCVPEPLVRYYVHGDNQISSDHSKKAFSKRYIYELYKDYIIKDEGLHARYLYEIGYHEYMNGERDKALKLFKNAFFLSPVGIKHLIRKVLSKLILGI